MPCSKEINYLEEGILLRRFLGVGESSCRKTVFVGLKKYLRTS